MASFSRKKRIQIFGEKHHVFGEIQNAKVKNILAHGGWNGKGRQASLTLKICSRISQIFVLVRKNTLVRLGKNELDDSRAVSFVNVIQLFCFKINQKIFTNYLKEFIFFILTKDKKLQKIKQSVEAT